MNVPNILTIIRLMLVPAFLLVFFSGSNDSMVISFLIFALAGLTDFFDGYIARKYNMVTKWGAILDPLADKLMSITVLISLTIKDIIPLWVLIIIAVKELLMIIGGIVLYNKGTYVPARLYGKAATALLYLAVACLVINKTTGIIDIAVGHILIYLTVAISLFAFYKYLDNYINYSKTKNR